MNGIWQVCDIIIFKQCRRKARGFILQVKTSSWRQFCASLISKTIISLNV